MAAGWSSPFLRTRKLQTSSQCWVLNTQIDRECNCFDTSTQLSIQQEEIAGPIKRLFYCNLTKVIRKSGWTIKGRRKKQKTSLLCLSSQDLEVHPHWHHIRTNPLKGTPLREVLPDLPVYTLRSPNICIFAVAVHLVHCSRARFALYKYQHIHKIFSETDWSLK